jgi:hypothetical protein
LKWRDIARSNGEAVRGSESSYLCISRTNGRAGSLRLGNNMRGVGSS